jgi:integral membrane protein
LRPRYAGSVADVNPRTAFRTVAIAEAVSWAGLLITMFFKWIVAADPHAGAQGGVPIMGPIHGVVFLAYVLMCFVAKRSFGWSRRTAVVALAASIPPFFTYVFEVSADRRGLLGQAAVAEPALR